MMHISIPGGRGQERKKSVKLTFKREELLYDIRNNAYVEGDVMQVNDAHDRHQVQDIGEEGNIDRVTRVLDLAHAECEEALFPYTKENVEQETEMDDMPTYVESTADAEEEKFTNESPVEKPTGDYVIGLLVPEDYSKTTVRLIVKYIHEYMVCRVLNDWLSITNPPAAAKWKEKQDEMLEGMKEAVNFRVGRVRRTLTPF